MGTTPIIDDDTPPEDIFAIAKRRAQDPGIQFVDVDELRNAEDLLVVISQRRSNGSITIAVFKEFQRDNERQRTAFIPSKLIPALQNLIALVPARIEQLRKEGRLVFKEKDPTHVR